MGEFVKSFTINPSFTLDIYPLIDYNIAMLKYSFHNSKLLKLAVYLGLKKNQVIGFDLPAGYTCPKAHLCKAFANPLTGKIIDGKGMKFRCYAASGENIFKNTRRARWNNFNILRNLSRDEIVQEIRHSLPASARIVRIHSSGDYFKRDYFDAWVIMARMTPNVMFFGYTKILEYARYAKKINLPNFKIVYSFGGKDDKLINKNDAVVYVIDSPDAPIKGLPVSCVENPADDYNYVTAVVSFCIPLHGVQPKGKLKRKR